MIQLNFFNEIDMGQRYRGTIHYTAIHLLHSANYFNLLTYETDAFLHFVLCCSSVGLVQCLDGPFSYNVKTLFNKT